MKMSAKSSSKLVSSTKPQTVKLGATARTPSSSATPLGKKNYSKSAKGAADFDFGNVNFGLTGLTGES